MQRDITGDGRQKRNNGRRRGGVRAYTYERRRPLDRHLKRAGESRPVNCGPRDRGVRRDRGATRWNNAMRGSSRRNAGTPRPSFHDLSRTLARSRVLDDATNGRQLERSGHNRGGIDVSNRSRE